jgi:hypothetical protein
MRDERATYDGCQACPYGAVFVFGSNLAGRHGRGAALHAREKHGAKYGCGEGPQGRSYAIPTKDRDLQPLRLWEIKRYVQQFLTYAGRFPDTQFFVTAVGTGLAGYTDADIAPMFAGAPPNCILPEGWSR